MNGSPEQYCNWPLRPQRNKQEDESYQLKEFKSLKPITNYQMSRDKI